MEIENSCPNCRKNLERNPRRWFVQVCDPPHLIIWAKIDRLPYWPAKIISTDDIFINIQFFGDHKMSQVLSNDCLIYSIKRPETNPPKKMSKLFKSALKVKKIF